MNTPLDEQLHQLASSLIDLAETAERQQELLNSLVFLIANHRFEKEHAGQLTSIDDDLWEGFHSARLRSLGAEQEAEL